MALPEVFSRTRQEGRAALVIYVTAGDPSLADTVDLVTAIHKAGADIVELGIPYSDPLADGPTIQAAGQRALAAGTTVAGVLECAHQIHERAGIPLVIMTCFNPILQFGPEQFAKRAAQAGVAGILVSDLPPEESREWTEIVAEHGLETIFLIATTTEPSRLQLACERSTGFVYVVSRPGTTGIREELPPELDQLLNRLRAVTERPLAVGFGLSTPAQVATVAQIADGVIVGSAVVQVIGEMSGGEELIPTVAEFVRELAQATTRGR